MEVRTLKTLRTRDLSAVPLLATLVALLLTLVSPSTAMAVEKTLCTGFSGCLAQGRGSDGYRRVYQRSHWGQYAGHNCTNYVAYRLIKNGALKPVSGAMGNAANWGRVLARYTNRTPAVGAIAWWDSSTPMGQSGHVAYVEGVRANGAVIVSEDHWRGSFYWKKYTKWDRYPTGFIHYYQREQKERPTVKITTPGDARLRVNVNPNLRGEESWKVRILKRTQGAFVRVRTVRTTGRWEIIDVNVPRGRYKVRVPAQKGHPGSTSRVVFVAR